MTNDELMQLKALALSLNGWHWPDRKRDPETGAHYFGQWKEGEFYELGTIDGSTYTDDYADDIRLLKFFRAVQPSTILALIAKVESLAADAERLDFMRQNKLHIVTCYEENSTQPVYEICIVHGTLEDDSLQCIGSGTTLREAIDMAKEKA